MYITYHLIKRPSFWLFFFLTTGVTGQTIFNSTKIFQEISLNHLSKPNPMENLFDFWVGEWDVHWEEEDGQIGKGTNQVKFILDSTAIEENFKVNSGSMNGFKGKSLSTFIKDNKQWKQVWMDNDGGYFEFAGDIENGFPIFKTEVVRRKGKEYKFRMVFRDIKTTRFIWDWEMSMDNGKTWDLKWQIFYLRK